MFLVVFFPSSFDLTCRIFFFNFVLFLPDRRIFFLIVAFIDFVRLLDFLLNFYGFFLFYIKIFQPLLVCPGVQSDCLVLFFPRRLPGCSSSIYENVYSPPLVVLASSSYAIYSWISSCIDTTPF